MDWIRRFVLHHNKRHPRDMGAAEVEAFLTHLAVAKRVSASTQNQAKSAVLFLYKGVLAEPTRHGRQNSGHSWGPLPRSGTVQTWICTTIMMPPKPSYNRGDVVLVLYPNSDLRTAKTHPAQTARLTHPPIVLPAAGGVRCYGSGRNSLSLAGVPETATRSTGNPAGYRPHSGRSRC